MIDSRTRDVAGLDAHTRRVVATAVAVVVTVPTVRRGWTAGDLRLDGARLLARPRIDGTGLRYSVTVLGGALPACSGACVLYVNAGSAEADGGSCAAPDAGRRQ
jgi:hypothetical protein